MLFSVHKSRAKLDRFKPWSFRLLQLGQILDLDGFADANVSTQPGQLTTRLAVSRYGALPKRIRPGTATALPSCANSKPHSVQPGEEKNSRCTGPSPLSMNLYGPEIKFGMDRRSFLLGSYRQPRAYVRGAAAALRAPHFGKAWRSSSDTGGPGRTSKAKSPRSESPALSLPEQLSIIYTRRKEFLGRRFVPRGDAPAASSDRSRRAA